MTPEERKVHLRNVAEKIKKAKEVEAKKDAEYYEKMTTGSWWKALTAVTIFCTLLSIIITIDTFTVGKTKPITQEQYEFDRALYAIGFQSVVVDGDLFLVPFQQLAGFHEDSFEVTYSLILGDAKFISFKRTYEDTLTEPRLEKYSFVKRISVYEWFPLAQLVLLIPLLVFLFKRPTPVFKFAYFTSLILIFPGSLILLLTLVF